MKILTLTLVCLSFFGCKQIPNQPTLAPPPTIKPESMPQHKYDEWIKDYEKSKRRS